MVRQTAKVIVFEVIGTLLLLSVAVALFLAFRLSSGPLDMSFFKADVEQALTQSREGRKTEIGSLSLEWSREDQRLIAVAEDVTLYTAASAVGAQAERAEIDLNARTLLRRQIEVLRLELQRGRLELQELEPGLWSVGGEPLPPIPVRERLPETPAEWIDAINAVLPGLLAGAQQLSSELALEDVSVEAFEVNLLNREGDPISTLHQTSAGMSKRDDGLAVRLSGEVELDGGFRAINANLSIDAGFETVAAAFNADAFPITAILGEEPDPEAGKEPTDTIPLATLVFSAQADRTDGVTWIGARGDMGPGAIEAFGQNYDIEGAYLIADYEAAEDRLVLIFEDLASTLVNGTIQVGLEEAVWGEEGYRHISVSGDAVSLNATPLFEEVWSLEGLEAQAVFDTLNRSITVESASLQISEETGVEFTGDLRRQEQDDAEGETFYVGTLNATLSGAATKEDILAFWPVRLGAGARRFVVEKVHAGIVTQASAQLDWQPDTFENDQIKDDHLQVSFDVEGAEVSFLDDFPHVTNAAGSAVLKGNSMRIALESGNISEWALSEGEVDFPYFKPRGEQFTVRAKGSGPITPLLQAVSDSRLQLEEKTGFDPDRFSGQGEGEFFLSRPALDKVPLEDMTMTVNGRVRNATLNNAAFDLDATNGSAVVSLDLNSITVQGFGDLGPIPMQFTFRDDFESFDTPADLSASALVTPDTLTKFGLLGRTFLSGEIPVELQAKLQHDDILSADVYLDLLGARLDVSEIGWIKPAEEVAMATFSYNAEEDAQALTARLDSDTAKLDGDIVLADNGRLETAILRRIFLKDVVEAKGRLARDMTGGLSISLTGAYLNGEGFVPDFSVMGGDGEGFSEPITIDAEVQRLTLRGGINMNAARLAMISTNQGLQSLSVAGDLENGKPFETYYQADAGGGTVRLRSGDAGFVMGALLGADFLEEGSIEVDGRLNTNDASDLDITIYDARLNNAPFLTQILSLASLRGLADTLSGEGVLFSEINIPLTVAQGRFIINGAKASGPALGLTANGFVETDNGGISVDGVLVPSFGLNSALGQVPIIGDLVVGRDGEGVFSLTYSVRGSLDRAQVSVNPLSAVAPGIIRRIFESPTTTDLPEFIPRADDDPIPSELEPLPPPEVIQ